MKIFALYFKILLTKKPEWLDKFIKKYFEPVDLHVTLIQPRYIDERQIDVLKAKVAEIVNKTIIENEDKKVNFKDLVVDKESDGTYTFMLNCHNNDFLIAFQEELKLALKDHSEYVDNVTEEYEINFKPHLTIAVNLDEQKREEAAEYFTAGYEFEGQFGNLVLLIVNDQSAEERNNEKNMTIFTFGT